MSDLTDIIERAMEEAGSVLTEVFDALKTPPPSQDELREAFRQAMMSMEGMQQFEAQYGREQVDRQMQLVLRRTGGTER